MREVSLSDRVHRTPILTPEEQVAAEAARGKRRRATHIRRVYATVWWVLVLPVAAAAGWLANQVSLWLIGVMAVSIVLLKPITALIARERRPRQHDDDYDYDYDYGGPEVDIAEVTVVDTGGGPAFVELDSVSFDEYAAEEREGQS